jgi:deoxycytidylate deaminase
MKIKKVIKLAKDASKLSDHPRVHIGAIVYNKNTILGVGFNQQKSHPLQKLYNKCRPYTLENDYLHAEIMAILNADYNAFGATLLVYRHNKNGELANCKPCEACQQAIKHYGIKKVIYIEDGIYKIEKENNESETLDNFRYALLP